VVVTLLSLIVLALMAVFGSTQRAFRAAVTQTDVLEGSRAAMDLIAADLRGLSPSDGTNGGPVNFTVLGNYTINNSYQPLTQALPGSSATRTNLLNYFFVLIRNSNSAQWIGIGYAVNHTNSSTLYPLYRYYAVTNLQADPTPLYNNFKYAVAAGQWTSLSHIVDGVVHLTVRAYDPNGTWINNNSTPAYTNALNTAYFGSAYGEAQFYMFSNTVPAAVELEMGVLEDQPLARAESLPYGSAAQLNYLSQQAGAVHVFRQRVTIPNVDTTAYP